MEVIMNCPNCKVQMLEYIYGFPTPDLLDKEEKGEVVLGGCSVHEYKPTHYCPLCHEQYPSADEAYNSYE